MQIQLPEAHLDEAVTDHLRTDFPTLDPNQTVEEALAATRAFPPTGRIIYFYVTTPEGTLVGVVPTRRLLLSELDQKIADIMITRVIAVPADATVLEACEFFTLHRLLAFPVVDETRKLLGIVDVELYTEELREIGGETPADRFGEDLFQLIGVSLAQAKRPSPFAAFQGRFPWLLANVAGGIMAALISGIYDDVLVWQQAVLALFIPVVLALSESVSIQSVTLTLEGLHGGRITWRRLAKKLRAELATGLLLGAGVATLVATVALIWKGQPELVACLLGGIVGGVTVAALVGVAIPSMLRIVRFDPQVAAGPIALAVADMLTLLIYFNLARALI